MNSLASGMNAAFVHSRNDVKLLDASVADLIHDDLDGYVAFFVSISTPVLKAGSHWHTGSTNTMSD